MSPFPPCSTRRTTAKGHPGLTLRVLSAWEVLEARREGRTMEETGREAALCANACLLSKALEREGKALYPDGEAVLRGLTVAEIAQLARQWAEFSREVAPSPRDPEAVDGLKKPGAHAGGAPALACAQDLRSSAHRGARAGNEAP